MVFPFKREAMKTNAKRAAYLIVRCPAMGIFRDSLRLLLYLFGKQPIRQVMRFAANRRNHLSSALNERTCQKSVSRKASFVLSSVVFYCCVSFRIHTRILSSCFLREIHHHFVK